MSAAENCRGCVWTTSPGELAYLVAQYSHDLVAYFRSERDAIPESKLLLMFGRSRHEGPRAISDLETLQTLDRNVAIATEAMESPSDQRNFDLALERRERYKASRSALITKLLTDAQRILMADPREGAPLVAYGFRRTGDPLELILPASWEGASIDWGSLVLTALDGTMFHGLRFLEVHEGKLPSDRAAVGRAILEDLRTHEKKTPEQDDGRNDPALRNVAASRLDRFLSQHVAQFEPGDAALTQSALLEVAQQKFSDNRVSREQVRTWWRKKMSPDKRFARGKKSRLRKN